MLIATERYCLQVWGYVASQLQTLTSVGLLLGHNSAVTVSAWPTATGSASAAKRSLKFLEDTENRIGIHVCPTC